MPYSRGVPDHAVIGSREPVVRSLLADELRELGVTSGDVVMVHTSMSQLGWVVGGTETVIRALLEVVGPVGTVMAYAGWEDNPWHLPEWPESWQRAYRSELPAFDPDISEARHAHGRLPERLRTWPGAYRSDDPEQNMVAVGAKAAWLTEHHPPPDPLGPDTPLPRLVEANGTC